MDRSTTKLDVHRFFSKTGCAVYQENGQRFCQSVSALMSNTVPPRGNEVFVAKLPRDCYENELYPVFSSVGEIYQIRLMMVYSGVNRGYGYVKYFTRQAAESAVKLINNYEIRPNQRLVVRQSLENSQLHVYNVDERVTEHDAAQKLDSILDDVTKKLTVTDFRITENGNLRQAKIEFDSHSSALLAMKKHAIAMQAVFGPNAQITWRRPVPF